MHEITHEWDNQNEDHSELNDHSELEFQTNEGGGGTVVVRCNETEEEWAFVGTPTMPSVEQLAKLEEWPINPPDKETVCDAVSLFGVRLVDAGQPQT